MNKLYASFNSPSLALRAAGALLDHGIMSEAITIINGDSPELKDVSTQDEPARALTLIPPSMSGGQGLVGTSMIITPEDGLQGDDDDSRRFVAKDATDIEEEAKGGISTTTAGDAAAGAAVGAELGLGLGAVAAVASLAIPGFGIILGGSALAIALAGVAATAGAGAIAGAVTGYLKDQGLEGHVTQKLANTIEGGGAFIEVEAPSGGVGEFEVRTIMLKYGATEVHAIKLGASAGI